MSTTFSVKCPLQSLDDDCVYQSDISKYMFCIRYCHHVDGSSFCSEWERAKALYECRFKCRRALQEECQYRLCCHAPISWDTIGLTGPVKWVARIDIHEATLRKIRLLRIYARRRWGSLYGLYLRHHNDEGNQGVDSDLGYTKWLEVFVRCNLILNANKNVNIGG